MICLQVTKVEEEGEMMEVDSQMVMEWNRDVRVVWASVPVPECLVRDRDHDLECVHRAP